MTVEETKILLKSESLSDVQKGIDEFANFVKANSEKKLNGTYAFFGLNKKSFSDEKLIKIEELDTVLTKFKDQLDSNSLIKIIESTLNYSIYDNFIATVNAIKILIKRKDVVGQNAVVESFKKACNYYDAGHRFYGNTIQDQLIDDLFPEFEGEPLVNLLCRCSDDFLRGQGGDDMDLLFKPAFEKIKNITELENKLLKRFEEYVLEYTDEGLDQNYIEEFEILEGYENASEQVQEAINNLKARVGIKEKALNNDEEGSLFEDDFDDKDDLLGGFFEDGLDDIIEQLANNSADLTASEKNAIIADVHEKCQTAEISDVIKFIEVFPKIENKEFRDLLFSSGVANVFTSKIGQQDLDEAYSMLEAYTNILPEIGHAEYLATGQITNSKIDIRQSFASDAVVLAVHMKHSHMPEYNHAFEMAEKHIPEHISFGVLAFNLCCWYAVNNNKEKLLHYTNLALNLGKQPSQFMNDSDFNAYKKDPDFLALLD